jgi:predicted nucleic acid-binding protein
MTPVLVDTSLWVTHLQKGHSKLQILLHEGEVATHPMIIGELACGNIRNRAEILALLRMLPMSHVAEHAEVLHFIEHHGLMGKGLGYIDAHLLASCALSSHLLWTTDKALGDAARQLSINFL